MLWPYAYICADVQHNPLLPRLSDITGWASETVVSFKEFVIFFSRLSENAPPEVKLKLAFEVYGALEYYNY